MARCLVTISRSIRMIWMLFTRYTTRKATPQDSKVSSVKGYMGMCQNRVTNNPPKNDHSTRKPWVWGVPLFWHIPKYHHPPMMEGQSSSQCSYGHTQISVGYSRYRGMRCSRGPPMDGAESQFGEQRELRNYSTGKFLCYISWSRSGVTI